VGIVEAHFSCPSNQTKFENEDNVLLLIASLSPTGNPQAFAPEDADNKYALIETCRSFFHDFSIN